MAVEHFLGERISLHSGDCRDVLASLPENSLDACVTDPPYHLVSIINRFSDPDAKPALSAAERRWAKTGGADRKPGTDQFGRLSKGFMGKAWDGGDIAFDPETWRAVLRVLKPGAHACVFCIPKHIGMVQVAMREAGFEFRDVVVWAFGSGFPKSHDVSKGIDRMLGGEREVVGRNRYADRAGADFGRMNDDGWMPSPRVDTAPATDAAREWEGWGTALKPAVELIILARKPREGTVAANVLKWGTGAINIDGCRVANPTGESAGGGWGWSQKTADGSMFSGIGGGEAISQQNANGRWPANLIHDGSAEVTAAFPDSESNGCDRDRSTGNVYGEHKPTPFEGYYDSGSAARFFYTAKADADDRLGSRHPTVKPLDLMQYLCRLVCRRGGTVLDPFAGTGTTAEAAWREGMNAVLIEREDEYCADIRRRMALALSGPDERARESIKAKNLPRDDGPLFASRESWTDMWERPFDWSKETAT